MKKNHFIAAVFALFITFPLFSQINFLSPLKGEWANKQMLIIDSASGDYFYSIDGSDPESFGFAYDGPVLLDVTGDIELKVSHIYPDGKKEAASVNFSVKGDTGRDTDYRPFIQMFYDSGLLNYSAGSVLSIPSELYYSLGLPPDSFLPGQDLCLSKESVLTRYIPCTLLDEKKAIKYRFIIKTYPQSAGIYSKRDVPFSIEDWDTIHFNNRNYLYKIDSEYWSLPDAPRKIDRSVSHMISWQNLDYEVGNPVEFFVLPQKPEIVTNRNEDGSILYTINGDSDYTMSVYSSEKKDYMELFPQIGADVFYGDKASGTLDIGVFANSVYQGKLVTNYEIDKRPPVKPEVKSTAKSFYSRDKVHVEVSATPGTELYIALSEPCTVPESDEVYTSESEVLKSIPVGQFRRVKADKFSINWGPRGSGPAYYKLVAYAKNGQNISRKTEYSIIVDQSSYYFDEHANPELAQGTAEYPFTSFEQCVNDLKKTRAVTLRVKGNLEINSKYQLDTNYEIFDNGEACITFGAEGGLVLKGSSLEIYDCRIKNRIDTNNKISIPMFRLENSVLTLKNCTLGSDFAKNGNCIDSYSSIINISDSILAVNSVSYASLISAVKSRISIKKSIISVSADTSVIISSNEGYATVDENTLSVSGMSGRIAELFGVKATFTDNVYKAQLQNSTENIQPVFVNSTTAFTESGNIKYGF